MDELFESLVREGMARMRWTRKRAEAQANRYLKRAGAGKAKAAIGVLKKGALPAARPAPKIRVVKPRSKAKARPSAPDPKLAESSTRPAQKAVEKQLRKKVKKARAKQAAVAAAIAKPAAKRTKPKKKQLTPLQRLERALGPDDGRRRGGSPFLQGGSPGLGRRR
ncbi:hypothetical protein ACFONC_09155 [Luteimonas soli]|uniref:Histone n=1 Tax=Luteimonas soli TaxID=1648966 RepID=A0ABV7XJH8_9GAMM